MDSIKQYAFGILAAALMCSILNVWIKPKGSAGAIVKLISGLFMTITLLAPLVDINLQDISEFFDDYHTDAQAYVQSGQNHATLTMGEIIKEQTQAYILDKAADLGLDVKVEVTLNETDPTVPDTVVLRGQVSPYGKMQLTALIEEQLGIHEEKQIWE